MTQSSSLRFYSNSFTNSRDKQPLTPPTIQSPDSLKNQPDNVQGWLMNVHTYRDPENISSDKGTVIVDADNNSIPTENTRKSRNGRPGSIASEDSVNLDELINANFTADMDDETDLPDLAALDLDDSNEDFWKLDNNNEALNSFDAGFDEFLSKSVADNYELDWSPSNDGGKNSVKATTVKTSLPVTPSSEFASRYKQRSDSISSENSLTSQSTITQYAKYGLTPMIYPSESSSSSSRSLSRLSNYSTASSSNTSGIPHPRTNSTSNLNTTGGIPTPSRSYTTKNKGTPGSPPRTKLAKRASHIPAPAQSPPSPQRTISSSSASNNHSHRIPSSTTAKRIPQRASHIPTVRESIHRPNSPLHNHSNSGRASATPSRIGMRSPTPGPRNSLFNTNTTTTSTTSKRSMTPTINKTSAEEKRAMSPTTTSRPSGLRPPGSSATSSVRSISRIGTVKKP